jgi:flagellar hook-basal body complex protein FliE
MSAAISAVAEIAANAPASVSGLGTAFSAFAPANAGAKTTPFSDLLTDAVGQINGLESQARAAVDGLISGKGIDVHSAMIATEKASMAFELALAVRNKAVQAYQSVMSMQF